MPHSVVVFAYATLLFTSSLFAVCNGQQPSKLFDVDLSALGLSTDLSIATTLRADDLSLSPFCNASASRGSGPYDPDNCASFAEQEVDMVMMLMDLLSKGVPSATATAFYSEIRCLSRSNIEKHKGGAVRVCFRRDYSKVVGELLAKYVKPVLPDIEKSGDEAVPAVSRVSDDRDVDHIFDELNAESDDPATEENSCCNSCYTDRYYPYLAYEMCVKAPYGDHCCHTVCKALERVKVGMDTSVSYCCPKLYPQPCWF